MLRTKREYSEGARAMAMEVHVFFRGKLPSKVALAKALKELEFPLTIPRPAGSLEKQTGFMPMRLRREEAGVEFDVFDGRSTIEELAGSKVDRSLDRTASFRWGCDEEEMLGGLCAAAAVAKLTNGVMLDEADGKLLSVDEAISRAREHLRATET